MPGKTDGLECLLPVVSRWFRDRYGEPTPPQQLGWPAIAAGLSTLILAPTGSGKTLAAFLACLDHLWRHPKRARGVGILYISPLKALNLDISRNLEEPLREILLAAEAEGSELPPITVAVRSGDTSPAERQRLIRKPPDVLITTPESLHLMLTSRARETLRTISHVIVDEIHALCGNKRGVFLSLLLERLEANTPNSFVRIGLSATQRPLDEVARYLGGLKTTTEVDGGIQFAPRPVTIIDTGQRKQLDLEVIAPFGHASAPRAGSVWPAIEQRLFDLIKSHRSTIIFANNRRLVERLTSHINKLANDDITGDQRLDDVEAGDGPVKSHHGSLSIDERRTTEESLKRGELTAVVATASLELGIDMGAVELVCQVESPGSIARGLQRVGRAGHLVGRISKGRLIAKTASDLIEAAALCRKMSLGEVEALRVPTNCLDILAQQVVACVAMDRWDVPELFNLVRRAYPYRDLTPSAFETVLKMISGRFALESFRDLSPRVSWDRIHNRLAALPGTARIAIVNGGTIPDTGQYPVYLGENGPRLGELDEEFVLERRVGETFVLGTATWLIEAIEPQRVIVGRAEGRSALMPFWRGEDSPRSAELGEAVGLLCREVANGQGDPTLPQRLRKEYHLDANAAWVLGEYIARQARVAGAVPDDRTVLVETYRDPAGELGLAVLTPFGGKLHQGLKLVLQARIRQRLGITAACLHSDEGLLFRIPQSDEPPLDIFAGVTADLAETLVRAELGESALFGLRFRQNAGRALLMPRPDPSKRTPLWLQRLRAKDLLQVVRRVPDFPIVVETYRECLNEDLDIPRLRAFLDAVEEGVIQVVMRRGETPSPFVSDLIFRFEHHFLYQWDEPKHSERPFTQLAVDAEILDPLLDSSINALWLDPTAVSRVESRLRGSGKPPRSAEEMAETLRGFGDLTASELSGPMLAFLKVLEQENRARTISLDGTREPLRWISVEETGLYESAFPPPDADSLVVPSVELETVVRRFLQTHALIGLEDLTVRYPIGRVAATELLERWVDAGNLVRLKSVDGENEPRWADERNLAEVRRLSIALRRKESIAVAPEVYADYLTRLQGVHPETRREGNAAFGKVLEQLQGFAAPAELWEAEIFTARIADYRLDWLDNALNAGEWIWRAQSESKGDPRAAFFSRDLPFARDDESEARPLSAEAEQLLGVIARIGASFTTDLARSVGLEPSRVRSALHELIRRGQVTNDRFDPLRLNGKGILEVLETTPARRPRLGRLGPSSRRPATDRGEGRWSRIDAERVSTDPESVALAWVAVLLERYGVLTRETVGLDFWAPPWRDLASILARAELRGEVRRGYFVEGLSGIQYASLEVAELLARHANLASPEVKPILISTLDPSNLYGSGAPLDINLLEGGTARLPRSAANYLVLCAGRPVLIIEGYGKRLTGLSSASEEELRAATSLLPRLAKGSRRVLKVESYNGAATLASPSVPWLTEIGFVRDHPGMTYYAGW